MKGTETDFTSGGCHSSHLSLFFKYIVVISHIFLTANIHIFYIFAHIVLI